jgi:hypothetical protein
MDFPIFVAVLLPTGGRSDVKLLSRLIERRSGIQFSDWNGNQFDCYDEVLESHGTHTGVLPCVSISVHCAFYLSSISFS